MHENFIIITVATHIDGYLPLLKKWSESQEVEFVIVGFGEKWKGWKWRMEILLNELEKYDKDQLILLVDGFDVIILADKEEIIDKFNSYNTDILLSCSGLPSTQPDSNWFHREIIVPHSNAYYKKYNKELLNAGTYIGKNGVLIEVLKRMQQYCINNNIEDDQIALNCMDKFDIKYEIDKTSNIFWIWDICYIKELIELLYHGGPNGIENDGVRYDDSRLVFKKNEQKPCIIHGVSNRNMDELTKIIGIPYKSQMKREIHQTSVRNLAKVIRMIGPLLIIIVLLVLIYKNH